ncbi:hypothetical protein [Nocardiopsis exhalans]|nr:hypothetical protein [Nocardiopsis exhalans]
MSTGSEECFGRLDDGLAQFVLGQGMVSAVLADRHRRDEQAAG